jgi:hypothetical protein
VVKRREWYLSGLILLVCAGCGTDPVERSATAPSASEEPGQTGDPMPGDEALTPPPPDPESGDHLGLLATAPDGPLEGDLDLAVSGLTAFAEPVTGTCAAMATSPVLEMTLSEGSTLTVRFDGDGGSLLLAAPGIEVRQTLDAVSLTTEGGSVSLGADLLTEGTTERSGRLALEATCG